MHYPYKNRKSVPTPSGSLLRNASTEPAVNLKMQTEHHSRKVGRKTQSHNSFYQVPVHFGSSEEGCEPPLNCLWSCCSGSCASVEGRLLKALVHCCITTSFSHHRLYHPLLFDVFFWWYVYVWASHILHTVCGTCLGPGPEKLLCVCGRFKVTEAHEGRLFSHWSQHKWAVVTACEMNRWAAAE